MRRTTGTLAGVVAAAAGLVGATAVPAQAAPGTGDESRSAATTGAATVAAGPEMLAALQRDLGLTPAQARLRLTNEDRARRVERRLRVALADRFAGAWLSPDGATLTVAVTDATRAGTVRASGAVARVVPRSERTLNAAQARLDAARAQAPAGVSGWYVDVARNSVVVLARPTAVGAAARFAAAAGVAADVVRVRASTEAPRPLYDVRGGDAYYINNSSRCSIGFAVQGGFVTAGHCGRGGASTAGSNRVSQGSVRASSFPGNDYGWVAVNSGWTPRGVVNRYNGGTVAVRGSSEASVGASICRSGSTTGWRCGTVISKNQTVFYSQGSVGGLTRTTACAEPGDSGGSWISGDQAQGVTSGGSGNCTAGGVTYFQPVNEILSAYGLRLVTS